MKQLPNVVVTKRGLNRVEAASYIGVGTTKFDELVATGAMPKPRCVGSRRVYDRFELDVAFDALPHEGEDAVNGWD